MAGTRATSVQKVSQPEVCKYKTVAAEERAIIRRHRAYCAKREKEMEGMTDQEKIEYMNRRGEEAMAKLGIARKPPYKPEQ